MKTNRTVAAKAEEIQRRWVVLDAQGKVLGRLASRAATILTGKDKPFYSPHVDCGDFVVIVNAEKVTLTGRKLEDKIYHRHTGYPGGLRSISAGQRLATKPEELLQDAVRGMVPKSKLGDRIIKKLKVYRGDTHPHAAQKPVALD